MMLYLLLALLGLLGVLSMTVAPPLLAWLRNRRQQEPDLQSGETITGPLSIAVLMPAHNEEVLIGRTLETISNALSTIRANRDVSVEVIVGADGCTDNTRTIAAAHGATVRAWPFRRGKWQTLKTLAQSTSADWVIFVDAGARWPHDLLGRVIPHFRNSSLIGVAPTYRNSKGGLVEQLLWWIERTLKRFESRCRGPISVHGATVCYQREALLGAFRELGDTKWINDDVVIPLVLRAAHRNRSLLYLTDVSVDEFAPPSRGKEQQTRRARMGAGNVQWIAQLWPTIWADNPVVGILALRRVARVFWAYWLILLAIPSTALSISLGMDRTIVGGVMLIIAGVLLFSRSLRAAFLTSLKAPIAFWNAPRKYVVPAHEVVQWR